VSVPYPLAQTAWSDSFVSVLPEPVPAVDPPAETSGFRGQLEDISLPSLLLILEMERKTGVLVLILEPALEKAFLHLSDGRVHRARISGRTEPRNAAAVHQLLDCRSGSFDFLPSDAIEGDEIQCSTTRLLIEGVRRRDEAPSPPFPQEKAEAASATGGAKVRARLGRPLRRSAVATSPSASLAIDAMAILLMLSFALLVIGAALCTGPGRPPSPANASTQLRSPTAPPQP